MTSLPPLLLQVLAYNSRMISPKKLCIAFLLATISSVATGQEVPVELPDEFSIRKVAGDELIPDASAMTVDPDSAPIVSGRGYVRRLLDENGDGVFDGFETLAATKGIAQGIWFDGKEMWLTVDGALKRSVSKEKGKPFVFEDVVPVTTGQEHGSHAIRRSADKRWWYVICGNNTKIRNQYYSLPNSPIKEPRAGFVMRFPSNVQTGDKFAAEIVCHGFRNPYDFDFSSADSLFVYDSDGERDVSLPWYRPTRVFRMRPGDDAGWVSASWKRPASFFDMPELVGELGRGSPTGVAVCKSNKFGQQYEDAVFVGDWTFGRIGVAKPGKEIQIFAKPKGNFGFAITDLEFRPTGELFVTTGGRGTEGSLYQIQKTAKGSANTWVDLPKSAIKRRAVSSDDPVEVFGVGGQSLHMRMNEMLQHQPKDVGAIIRQLQLHLGGCAGDRMFAGHQAKRPVTLTEEDAAGTTGQLHSMLHNRVETFEVARLVGMLRLKDKALLSLLSEVACSEEDPVKRIHYLNCLAVTGGKLDAESVTPLAKALLRVRRQIDDAELPVDRNWKPRMQQLADELFRDMRIPEAIAKDVSFGQPSDIWIYNSLPEIFRSIARAKIAAKIQKDPAIATKEQLQCISVDRKYSEIVRSFSNRDEFRDIVVMAVKSNPQIEDKSLLLRGTRSFNLTVVKASLIGLKKLEIAKPDSDDFKSLLQLEQSLGWSNPEVSIRDQIVGLLQQWTGKSQGYQLRQYDIKQEQITQQRSKLEVWKKFLAEERGVEVKSAVSVNQLLERYARIDFTAGDSQRGKLAYKKFQCASCHDGGGQNSGPSLTGIASRFSRNDVLRAIVDPNDNVPDRYRAVVVATEDGQLFRGSVVYESMAGIMLATSTGEIVRVDAEDVESRRKSNQSLMPEGLLNEATDQEVADLWAYLSKLHARRASE